jgi:putative membrane protein
MYNPSYKPVKEKHSIAAKLSARLGEGVLNGLLTARVGLSAMAVCRPDAFRDRKGA